MELVCRVLWTRDGTTGVVGFHCLLGYQLSFSSHDSMRGSVYLGIVI